MKKYLFKMKFYKRNLIIAFLVTTVILLLTAIFFVYYTSSKITVKTPILINNTSTSFVSPVATKFNPKEPYNILLLGYGGGNHEGGYLTDTMIIANINPENEKITLISIPRDIYLKFPISNDSYKINHAYAIGIDDEKYPNKPNLYKAPHGGGELAKYIVKEVTNLNINYFVSVSFDGFEKAIDILGGVNVYVPSTFDDEFYPIEGEKDNPCGKSDEQIARLTATMSGFLLEQQFTCRYEKLHFEQGLMFMDSKTALKFVRSRHSKENGGDFARSERQKALILGIKSKALSLGIITKAVPLYLQFINNVQTDIDLPTAKKLISTSGVASKYTISSITLTTDNILKESVSHDGQYILLPRDNSWTSVHAFIKSEMEKQ